MAILAKTEIKDTGLYVEYWRVMSASRNMDTNKIEARIVAYTDEASRKARKKYVLSTYQRYDASKVPLDINLIEWVYNQLKKEILEEVMPEIHEMQIADLTEGEDV